MSSTSTRPSGVFAGRYAIERELGRGGSALVYLARDQQRGHAVALKLLRPELAESLGADRFLREIRVSQQLHHPHIVPVLDSGKHDGQLYFVLPHMEGGTLRQLLQREKQLAVDDVIAITRTIAIALAYAHERGLVHRDVKPENILFTSGQACLSDFGIARALERAVDESTTSTSVVRGTPPYMSPEQASGERELDARSDIYSFGCVVYEMLAGIQPFVGPTPQSVIAQRLTHPPRPIRAYRSGLPTAVEGVMQRVLAITRADRYQTAIEFADALQRAADTPDDPGALKRERRRRLMRYFTYGVAGAAALAAAVFVGNSLGPKDVNAGIPEGDARRVAVLYLDDMTPASLPSYVADGLTEDLIDQLGDVRTLHVISSTGVRPFRNRSAPLDSMAAVLKVGTIISGSVARSGDTVRVNVRLVDAKTGKQLSSASLQQPWAELFALQDKLTGQVAFWLRQRLGDAIALRERRAATRSYASWESVRLAGDATERAQASFMRNDPEGARLFLQADSLYARAEQMDRSWALPSIKRGRIALSLAFETLPSGALPDSAYQILTPIQRRRFWIVRAIDFADSALQRAPRSAEAYALRGDAKYTLVLAGLADSDSLGPEIERDANAARAIRPDVASASAVLAKLYRTEGRFGESAEAAERAFEADAFFESRPIVSVAFFSSLHAEQFDKARRWCRLALDHYAADPRFIECELTLLGWTGKSRADVNAAWHQISRIEQRDTVGVLKPTWEYRRLMVAAILARAGITDSARAVLSVVQKQPTSAARTRSSALSEAYVRLLLDDRDGALTRVTELVRAAPQTRTYVARHPWLRSLHNDPRFTALIRPAP